ncbi:hypothetical protein [Siphonobacter sp. SORGH_AS_0500]|uniref:hypothetical protein n=1 Tax=Siphonobacter sp. SORGH_AS_0500 TaxID=1864824 RepID=UPI00286446AC|nr:hypothetical protein [Siphonobacter sp. SORGH_AS_0500]MDR6194074.1 hypothetical protein [Siphonobacter sp. SORGH_AS_0500]
MNTYKTLRNEVDPKIVGVKHGAGQGFLDEEFYSNHPLYKDLFIYNDRWPLDIWKKWASWKEYGQQLRNIQLYNSARKTDILYIAGLRRGLIVSERVINILNDFNLPDHNYFDITLNKNGEIISGYKWLCFNLEIGEHTVNFQKCSYNFKYLISKGFTNYKKSDIKNYEDYISIYNETGSAVLVNDLILNKNFNNQLDLWVTQFLTSKIYISNRLIDALEAHNISGLNYEDDIYDIYIESE